jgi:hypothetical protein
VPLGFTSFIPTYAQRKGLATELTPQSWTVES